MFSPRKARRPLALLCILLLLSTCSSTRPVLKANPRYQAAGETAAQAAIEACMADQPGSRNDAGEQVGIVAAMTVTVAGAGAFFGVKSAIDPDDIGIAAAVGAAIGSVIGFVGGLYAVTESEIRFRHGVEDCLRERGYAPGGWE